jgi:hypothetical protein
MVEVSATWDGFCTCGCIVIYETDVWSKDNPPKLMQIYSCTSCGKQFVFKGTPV